MLHTAESILAAWRHLCQVCQVSGRQELSLCHAEVPGNPVDPFDEILSPGTLPYLSLFYYVLGSPESIHSLAVVFPSSWVWSGGAGVFTNTHSRHYDNSS